MKLHSRRYDSKTKLCYCSKCGSKKPVKQFGTFVQGSSGKHYIRTYCKACTAEYSKKPEHREKRSWSHIKRKFGLTQKQYEDQLARQKGVCALCLKKPDTKRLAVDHDHSHHSNSWQACSECIRGLLCFMCNRRVLPYFEKNPHWCNEFLREYLAQRPFSENFPTESFVFPPNSHPLSRERPSEMGA